MRNNRVKGLIQNNPISGPVARMIHKLIIPFPGSDNYWTKRYQDGGNSGDGSYGQLAAFKARTLNCFVSEHNISSVIEYGCGDGNQLKQAEYPKYIGFDVSKEAVDLCQQFFEEDATKQFELVENYNGETAKLTLSLDVIYHLVEDPVFDAYMKLLFDSSEQFVIIYSSNTDENPKLRPPHVRHRAFSKWIEENKKDWKFLAHIPNEYPNRSDNPGESFADFYIYETIESR